MVLYPAIQLKPVEADALLADGQLGQLGADLGVEAIPVHAEVAGCIAKTDNAGRDVGRWALAALPPNVTGPALLTDPRLVLEEEADAPFGAPTD